MAKCVVCYKSVVFKIRCKSKREGVIENPKQSTLKMENAEQKLKNKNGQKQDRRQYLW